MVDLGSEERYTTGCISLVMDAACWIGGSRDEWTLPFNAGSGEGALTSIPQAVSGARKIQLCVAVTR